MVAVNRQLSPIPRAPEAQTDQPSLPGGFRNELLHASDEKLAELSRSGENSAFEVLMKRLTPELNHRVLRRIGSQSDVPDVVQEVWIRAHSNLDTFDTTRNFKAWIFTIANRICIDFLRQKGRRERTIGGRNAAGEGESLIEKLVSVNDSPESRLVAEEGARMIRSALNDMRPAHSEVLGLALRGLSYSQIGKQLDIPAGTVKSRLFSAHRAAGRALRREADHFRGRYARELREVDED